MTSLFSSPHFLRNVLLADAASCFATGGLQVAFTGDLASALRLPTPLLVATGVFMLAYAALAAWTATRSPIPRGLVWLFVVGNFGWAAGCVALLVSGLVAPTVPGQAWVIAQAVTVVILAELQWAGVSRATPPGWA